MERMLTKKATAAGYTMEVTVMKIGEDFQICLAGGEKPHIGCVVQAVPRESLTGDGSWSATSSVWNRTGHKDEVLCRMLAEKICCACRTVTVCTGGVHIDRITGDCGCGREDGRRDCAGFEMISKHGKRIKSHCIFRTCFGFVLYFLLNM